jgi:putative transcriptional regulator
MGAFVTAPRAPVLVIVAAWVALAALPSRRVVAAQSLGADERVHRAAVQALAAGKLLVAARRLPDPNFGRAVILLAEFTDHGAVGIVLNRRSEVPLARVFPHLMPTLASAGPAFLGGPVETTRPVALVRASAAPAGARRIFDGIYLLVPREAVEAALASSATSSRIRIYLGYAGWDAGQLEAETAAGVWHVLAGDTDAVFDPDPASTWQRQIARTELIQARRATGGPWPTPT